MDLQQLRYVVTVAETGSITAAAKKLFMGQPNLSRSIRELEEELGIRIFARTPRGAALTSNGEEFLRYARSILAQMEQLEALYRPGGEPVPELAVTGPRASYISKAFGRYLRTAGRQPLCARYRETSAAGAISDVSTGAARLGVVRWQAQHTAALESLMRENGLSGETLWEFSMVVAMHESHPLAGLPELPFDALRGYPELVHGDLTPVLPEQETPSAETGHFGYIAVFDRGGQFDLLREVPGSYIWVSPIPADILAQMHLVQRPCRSATRYRDILVRRRPGALYPAEIGFVNELRREIEQLEKAAEA